MNDKRLFGAKVNFWFCLFCDFVPRFGVQWLLSIVELVADVALFRLATSEHNKLGLEYCVFCDPILQSEQKCITDIEIKIVRSVFFFVD